MNSRFASSLGCAAWLLLAATSADAQQLAGTFDQLRVLVKPGDRLTITDTNGKRMRGRLSQVSASSLVLNLSGGPLQLHESDIDTIEMRGPDSLRNGALAGLAIGAGLGALAGATLIGEPAGAVYAALAYGGMGAGIGAGIDALIEGRRIIYAATTRRTTLNVAPMLGRGHRGVRLSVQLAR